MHIVYVCNELPPAPAGGIGPYVRTMACAMAEHGHEVTVIGFYDRPYDWDLPGVNVVPITRYSFLGIGRVFDRPDLKRLAIHMRLRRLHARHPIDVIEWPDYEGLYVKPIRGVVDVLRNHGPLFSHADFGLVAPNKATENLELAMMRRIPNWSGVSQWFMDYSIAYSGADPARKSVIYNAVDTALFRPALNARIKGSVLYAGSFTKRKGVFQLVRAANIFLSRNPEASLWVVGKSDERSLARLEKMIERSVRARVFLLHPVPQATLAFLMQRIGIFAMPSLLESFGNVWAEAMASGMAVVGSKLTCGPEVVPDGVGGILADPNNIAEVADVVDRLLRNPDLQRTLGEGGRQIAEEKYSLSKCAGRTVEFYERCIRVAG